VDFNKKFHANQFLNDIIMLKTKPTLGLEQLCALYKNLVEYNFYKLQAIISHLMANSQLPTHQFRSIDSTMIWGNRKLNAKYPQFHEPKEGQPPLPLEDRIYFYNEIGWHEAVILRRSLLNKFDLLVNSDYLFAPTNWV
jgi:hypothetical protein